MKKHTIYFSLALILLGITFVSFQNFSPFDSSDKFVNIEGKSISCNAVTQAKGYCRKAPLPPELTDHLARLIQVEDSGGELISTTCRNIEATHSSCLE